MRVRLIFLLRVSDSEKDINSNMFEFLRKLSFPKEEINTGFWCYLKKILVYSFSKETRKKRKEKEKWTLWPTKIIQWIRCFEWRFIFHSYFLYFSPRMFNPARKVCLMNTETFEFSLCLWFSAGNIINRIPGIFVLERHIYFSCKHLK